MEDGNSVFINTKLTERSLIESILASHYIIDYGFIKNVNPDKTVDVTHAKQLKTLDGQSLKATVTPNVEVLTIAGGGFSINFDYKKGDKVLLLGLKDYVPKVEEVTSATETTAYLHYSRETIKAIPLCIFNDEAKVTVQIENGAMKVDTQDKIELNGNSKQFVTWAELNQALANFTAILKTHTHQCAAAGSPSGPPVVLPPATLDIDITAAKTKKVVTGG